MYLGKKQKIPARGHLGSLSGVARVVINSQIQVLRVLCMFLERASQDNARARNLQPRGREEAVSFKKIDRDSVHFSSSYVCVRISDQTDVCLCT